MLKKVWKLFLGVALLTSLVVIWKLVNDFDESTPIDKCNYRAWRDGALSVLKPHIAKNCRKLFAGDAEEVKRVSAMTIKWKNSLSEYRFFLMTMNCSWVKYYFNNNLYVTELERSFPLAFSFLINNSPQQVLRLLKVIYRPHNQYCIIPDSKSSPDFIGIFKNIAACLSNVNIASKLIPVQWGHHSIMDAQMTCLKDLLDLRERQSEQSKWKYVINLCGKELPLATNHEIVSYLVGLSGSSALAIRSMPEVDYSRLSGNIPFNLTCYKSSTYMGLSFDFARFLFTSSMAIKVRQFFKSCVMPEENFYATLAVIPGVPGGFDPNALRVNINHCFWRYEDSQEPCNGKVVHYICIPKIGDLSMIMRETEDEKALFFNKYIMEYDHTLMDCMEEELISRNKREFVDDGSPEEMDADGCIHINP